MIDEENFFDQIDLTRKQALATDTKATQEINFAGVISKIFKK